jgi:hypothetical protein
MNEKEPQDLGYEMMTEERKRLVAPCGIDCGLCELYTCKDDEQLFSYLVSRGLPRGKIPCTGCRAIEGRCPVIGSICATYLCVSVKKVDFCFDCQAFPCSKLNPSADRADVLPHNLKVFNLCTIQRKGVEDFIECSMEFKKRYYKGKMEIGNGPQVE